VVAKGISGQMAFDGESVTITRRGLMPWLIHGSSGNKSIPVRSITAVQYRKCGFYQGYLQLSVSGELENGGGRDHESSRLASDENTILFYWKGNQPFQALTDDIRAAIRAQNAPVPAPSAAPAWGVPPAPTVDVYEELERLTNALNQGWLTADEYGAKKAELLSRL
jgi:hypothetical protein